MPNRIRINNLQSFGFSSDLTKGVHVGRSSAYVAMQVAAWMKYDSVYILGIDMTTVEKNGETLTHFYGIIPDMSVDLRRKRFEAEARHYEYAAKVLSDAERYRFVFCSSYNPFAFTAQFRRLDHVVAVESILQAAERTK